MEEKEIVHKGYNKTAEKLEEIFGVKKEGSDKLKFGESTHLFVFAEK